MITSLGANPICVYCLSRSWCHTIRVGINGVYAKSLAILNRSDIWVRGTLPSSAWPRQIFFRASPPTVCYTPPATFHFGRNLTDMSARGLVTETASIPHLINPTAVVLLSTPQANPQVRTTTVHETHLSRCPSGSARQRFVVLPQPYHRPTRFPRPLHHDPARSQFPQRSSWLWLQETSKFSILIILNTSPIWCPNLGHLSEPSMITGDSHTARTS